MYSSYKHSLTSYSVPRNVYKKAEFISSVISQVRNTGIQKNKIILCNHFYEMKINRGLKEHRNRYPGILTSRKAFPMNAELIHRRTERLAK